jgi:predicted small secreted protein
LALARTRLKVSHAFEAEYNLDGATLMVYPTEKTRRGHFSFNVYSSGSSTIKNLSAKHQPMAQAVLRALNVVDGDEPAPTPAPEPEADEGY